MQFVIEHKLEIVGALLAISEVLAFSPLKSNSVFQLIVNSLKGLYELFKPKA